VDETGGCVAIRRAQAVVFDGSESINACPKLRNRPTGPCSAACVPLSVAGRPVGVLHTVSADRHPPDDRVVSQLATLSTQLGNRLGALRALESSRHEAATDKLTGLPNRRLLESQIATLIERSTPFVLVLADLDKFKNLNDSYGHEVGDRALQLFAQVLRDKVRGNDVIARLGGEEFVLVYPNMSVTTSIEAIERIRDGLANALAVSRLPEFTCSFGITHSAVGRSGDAILRVADAGLLRAKELGGDQVVYADETLAARMFSDDDPQPGRPAAR
jgi:diguanylate cyclase (GGDEF)-like protein